MNLKPKPSSSAFLLKTFLGVLLSIWCLNLGSTDAPAPPSGLLDETSVDPALWGKEFSQQYKAYLQTNERYTTKYGGSGSDSMAKSRLEADPRLVTLFDGYAFAIDFNQRQGHAYMLQDQRTTKRVTQKPQTGACLHCHASNTVAYREEGIRQGAPGSLKETFNSPAARQQLMTGFESICKMPYKDATKLIQHPLACLDCHDPKNMQLRVTKPGFIRGVAALAQSSDPLPHLPSIGKWRNGDRKEAYDVNREASRDEMRSMVCGQCHVEYYCGPKTTLFFPWNKGLKVEQIEAYYDDYKFSDGHRFFDWKHAKADTELLKAQHPEFETWSQGIHARSGVSCADCHMPSVQGKDSKISDHQVRSPLKNIAASCQSCHGSSEEELTARVELIQDRTHILMSRAEDAVVALIQDLDAARKAGLPGANLHLAKELHRKAQWRLDFVNAENSMGFHAPQETARILAESIDYARQGQLALKSLGAAVNGK